MKLMKELRPNKGSWTEGSLTMCVKCAETWTRRQAGHFGSSCRRVMHQQNGEQLFIPAKLYLCVTNKRAREAIGDD